MLEDVDHHLLLLHHLAELFVPFFPPIDLVASLCCNEFSWSVFLFCFLLSHRGVFAISEDRRKEGYKVTQSPKELSRRINRYKIFWKEQLKG